MKKKKKKGKKLNDRNASWSWRIREVWCWVGETMLQQECHLSHPWHDALHHCVPWSDSLFVQTFGSIKNDPQLSQRPSTRSKRQTEVKRQTIFQYRCLIFTACSIAGADGRRTSWRQSLSLLSNGTYSHQNLLEQLLSTTTTWSNFVRQSLQEEKKSTECVSFHPTAPCRWPRDFVATTAMPPDSNPGRNLAKRLLCVRCARWERIAVIAPLGRRP